ncbi:SGNH/GDSL hydrolase family protein [Acinetobacter baumannii]|nr:SGNH/GDSL hydrolase family protein [Acinetobacter baumannii]
MPLPNVNDFIGTNVTQGKFKQAQKQLIEYVEQLGNNVSAAAGGKYGFNTIADFEAVKSSLPNNSVVNIASGSDAGDYVWNGSILTKSPNDSLTQSKKYTDEALLSTLSDLDTFVIDEHFETSQAAHANGTLFATQLLQSDVTVNEISFKVVSYGGLTSFNAALYLVDSKMNIKTVLSTHSITVVSNPVYKISGLNIVIPKDQFIAIGIPSGIALAHRTLTPNQTKGFYYSQNISNATSLPVGYTPPTMQNLNAKCFGFKLVGRKIPTDYYDIEKLNHVSDLIVYDYISKVATNTNANGELYFIPRAYPSAKAIKGITLKIKRIVTVGKTSVKIRPYFKRISDNVIISAGELIEVTGISEGSSHNIPLNMTFPPDCYFGIGVETGIDLGYYNNDLGGTFHYSATQGASALTVEPNQTKVPLQTIVGAVGFAFTVENDILFNPDNYVRKSDVKLNLTTNYLYGKKIVAIGDSMVQGHSLSDASNQTWLAKLAIRNNMTRVNYGINGTYLSNKLYGSYEGAVIRYTAMDNDADYVLVFAGTNDARNSGVPMGTDDSTDNTTFKGALNVLCNGLITKYPNKKIGFITPYLRDANYPAYIDAIKTICKKYSIPVFDNSERGGVCWTNTAQLNAITLNDTYHLNETGMEFVSYKYEDFIRSL